MQFCATVFPVTMIMNGNLIPIQHFSLQAGLSPSALHDVLEHQRKVIEDIVFAGVRRYYSIPDEDITLPSTSFMFTLKTIGPRGRLYYDQNLGIGGPFSLLIEPGDGWVRLSCVKLNYFLMHDVYYNHF